MSFYRSCGLIQEQGSEEAAAAWDVAVGATLACDGAPPTLGDMALADGAAATHWPRTPHIRPECHAPGPARDVPAPPRRVALCNGPFGWMVSIVGCVGTLAHIL